MQPGVRASLHSLLQQLGEVKEPIWTLRPHCRIAVTEKAASLHCRSSQATAKKSKGFLELMLYSF